MSDTVAPISPLPVDQTPTAPLSGDEPSPRPPTTTPTSSFWPTQLSDSPIPPTNFPTVSSHPSASPEPQNVFESSIFLIEHAADDSSKLRGSLTESSPLDESSSGILGIFRSKFEHFLTAPPTLLPSLTPTSSPIPVPKYAGRMVSKYPGRMEAIYVSLVGDTGWTIVSLGAHYNSAIPVCTVQYPWEEGWKALPAIVRVQNVLANSFEVRLQSPRGDVLSERPVHCIVVEQGSWVMPNGRTIEANQYVSTKTDHSESFEGEMQNLKNSFQNPIVIGQVLSYNDPGWSAFWSHGNDVKSGVTADAIYTGKHVGSDDRKSRINESVGYIVFESGHDAFGGIEIEAARGGAVKSYVNGSQPYIFESSFITAPMVAVLSGAGMAENNGYWPVLCSTPTNSLMFVAIDEDRNSEMARFPKGKIDYVAFSITGTVSLQSTKPVLKHQWYLPNIFSKDSGNGRRNLNDENTIERSPMSLNERPTAYVRRPSTDEFLERSPVTNSEGAFLILAMVVITLSAAWITTRYKSAAQHYQPSK